MTALRPEHDAAGYDAPQEYEYGYDPQAYGAQQYGEQGDFGADTRAHGHADGLGAAVDRLADPLNDPLPGQQQAGWVQEPYGVYDPYAGQQGTLQPPPYQGQQYAQAHFSEQQYRQPPAQPEEWYDPEGYRRDWYGPQQAEQAQVQQAPQAPQVQQGFATGPQGYVQPQPYAQPESGTYVPSGPQAYVTPSEPQSYTRSEPQPYAPEQPANDETFALPTIAQTPRRRRIVEPESQPDPSAGRDGDRDREPAAGTGSGGRAGRRKGASRGGEPVRKDGAGVVVSRFVGELFITFGVVMLLFVTYQLWWTNVRAGMQADGATHSLQDDWAKGGAKPKAAGAFEPGQGFAIMHIPKLDVKVPVAEGIDKHKVLDRGMVGHYADGKLKTAMPADKQGNFSVAGHRNTHGEPFRYVNRLVKGDKIVVETQDAFYTYEMTSMLPQTSPANVSVIQPVPVGSGFTKPGRYITLTTCTPEFTSTYRLIVWGKMVDERPRSKGMPAALDG